MSPGRGLWKLAPVSLLTLLHVLSLSLIMATGVTVPSPAGTPGESPTWGWPWGSLTQWGRASSSNWIKDLEYSETLEKTKS